MFNGLFTIEQAANPRIVGECPVWITLLVAAPELRTAYELRLRFDVDRCHWDAVVSPQNRPPCCFAGDCHTTAHDLFRRIFAAIGHPELAPAVA